MAFIYILPVILLVIFTASFILPIIGTIQSEYSNICIPAGVNHPGKLRIVHASMVMISALVSYSAMFSARNVVSVLFL